MGISADSVRDSYLLAAASAVTLLNQPAVAAAWNRPSALAKLTVGGLAAHLGRQIIRPVEVIEADPPAEAPVSVLDHYRRSPWTAAGIDDEPNVSVRDNSEADAKAGAAALRERVEAALATLRQRLSDEPTDRVVALPWTDWPLSLDDFLATRVLEIVIHSDDLPVSVGIPTPELPASVTDPVLRLLCRLATERHGPTAVLRTLSRSERAPATISAF